MRFALLAPTVLLTILAPLYCQEEDSSVQATPTEAHAKEALPPCQTPANVRFDVRHIEAGGIGYNQGYTTGALFGMCNNPIRDRWYPFIDLRGHVFNNGYFAANAGLGLRYVRNGFIYGINSYYDYRNKHRFHSNQVGGGLEFFSNRWEARINGYFPVGKTQSGFFGTAEFDSFRGHYLYVKQRQTSTFMGGDGEVAGNWRSKCGWTFLTGAGPYYLHGSNNHNVYGGKGRARASYKQYAFLELSGSYDNVFHGQIQGQIGFSIPLGPKPFWREKSSAPFCSADLQQVSSPYRSEIIPFEVNHNRNPNPAINSATGLPWFFIFVDNTSHSAGTFESPYPDLASAQAASNPNDVIYVFPGDGSTTGLTTGFVMKDNQQLLGTSFAYPFDTNYGTIPVPAMSATRPHLAATDILAATMAHNCKVSGLYITSTITAAGTRISAISNSTAAAAATVPQISNPVVTNNYIEQTVAFNGECAGVRLVNAIGTANISANTLTTTYSSLASLLYRGLYVTNSTADGSVLISNNNVSLTGTTVAAVRGIQVASLVSSNVSSQILNNTIFSTLTGGSAGFSANIMADARSSGSQTTLIQGNTLTGGAALVQVHGIIAYGIGGTNLNAQILANTVATNNVADAFTGCITVRMQSITTSNHLVQGNTTSIGANGIVLSNESGTGTYNCNNNSTNNTAALAAQCTVGTMCLRYQNNTAASSATNIGFTRTGGTFNLEPLVGNTGVVSQTGTITNVAQDFCGD